MAPKTSKLLNCPPFIMRSEHGRYSVSMFGEKRPFQCQNCQCALAKDPSADMHICKPYYFKRHSKWDLVGDTAMLQYHPTPWEKLHKECMSEPVKNVRTRVIFTGSLVLFSRARSYIFHGLALKYINRKTNRFNWHLPPFHSIFQPG